MNKNRKIIMVTTVLVLLLSLLAACGAKATPAPDTETIPKPSNPGGPGEAVNLTGNATTGAQVFADNCASCHGDQGKTGIANPGSADGTVPSLNPIDEALVNADAKTFATNIDLFVEHGSTPEGSSPTQVMTAFGDKKLLTSQQIADVIAYVISLNK
jgi:mono/diheme cytochrome c family protein